MKVTTGTQIQTVARASAVLELVAADTAEQARAYFDGLAGEAGPDDWFEVDDDEIVEVVTDTGLEARTAAEWAAGCPVPREVATTNG